MPCTYFCASSCICTEKGSCWTGSSHLPAQYAAARMSLWYTSSFTSCNCRVMLSSTTHCACGGGGVHLTSSLKVAEVKLHQGPWLHGGNISHHIHTGWDNTQPFVLEWPLVYIPLIGHWCYPRWWHPAKEFIGQIKLFFAGNVSYNVPLSVGYIFIGNTRQ